jgi:hypothetical protein
LFLLPKSGGPTVEASKSWNVVIRDGLPFATDSVAQPNAVESADPVPTPYPGLAVSGGRRLTVEAGHYAGLTSSSATALKACRRLVDG